MKQRLPNPDQLVTDMLRMQDARTWTELEAVCANIEARQTVEGVSDTDRRAYEAMKTQHARRVALTLVA